MTDHSESRLKSIGSWIAFVGIILPSMLVANLMPDWNVLPAAAWIAISAACGGFGYALGHQPRIASFVGGLTAGACVPLALILYVHYRNQFFQGRFSKIELVLPFLAGAIPGVVAYMLLKWAFTPADDGFGQRDDARSDEARDDLE